MKKVYIISALLALLLTSCDEYLDVVPRGKQLLETVEDYSKLQNTESMLIYGRGDVTQLTDDDWANPRVAYNGVNSPAISSSHMLYQDPQLVRRLELHKNATGLYSSSYSRIQKICNITLSTIDNVPGDAALREKTKAEVRALRAYNYFMLVNIYAKHYSPETVNDLAVPLSLTFDMENTAPQATVGQIYKAIEDDLNAAIPVLEKDSTRQNAYHFSAAAAYALRAKVLLFKKDFAGAKTAALASYNLFKKKTDFIFDQVAYYNTGMSYIVVSDIPENLYFASSDSRLAISPDLFNVFKGLNETKDVRYAGFFTLLTGYAGTPTSTDPDFKGDADYAPAFDETRKLGAKNYRYNYAGLRTTDVVLMLAELEARSDNYPQAAAYVDMVRKKRVIGYVRTVTPTTRAAMMDEVITERRREFVYGFNRWFDLRRLNTEPEYRKNLSKVFPANPAYTLFSSTSIFGGAARGTLTLPYDSYLWVVPLPYDEFPRNLALKYNVPY